jgi:Ca-activated chloride channel family protein
VILLRHPWFLALLALLPLIWWAWRKVEWRTVIRYTGASKIAAHDRPWSIRWRLLIPILRCTAVALLILCLARPQKADEQTRIQTEGIAIQLIVDRSGSMGQEDFRLPNGSAQSRLAAVKDVVKSFVEGDGRSLEGRPNDLVGLIAFAHYADTECPLTHDHKHLTKALKDIELPTTRDEDGTAIGDALLLAVERIRNIGRKNKKSDDFQVKSRIIVLLTDGEQNRGKYLPKQAAEAAAALGVKVYTIGAAPDFQEQQVMSLFQNSRTVKVPIEINEDALKEVAEKTGGKYFRARDPASLAAVYQEIDRLEKSAVDEERFYVYDELGYNWAEIGGRRFPPPLIAVLVLLALEVFLAHTRFRKIP